MSRPVQALLLAALASPSTALAGAFEVAQQGAAAGGTAHAGTALVDRAESAWFNPAALTDGGGLRVALGAAVARSSITATSRSSDAWTTRTNTPLGTPPYIDVAYSGKRWAVALAANVPFGGGVRWPEDAPLRFDALQSKPQFFRVTASFAYQLGPIAFGAGVHVDTGSLLVDKAVDFVDEEGRVHLLTSATGVGGDGYLMAHVGRHATIGATYKSRTALKMKGKADFDLPPAFADGRPDQDVTAPWTLPDRLALGFAWTDDRFFATVEADLTLWEVNDVLAYDFADPRTEDVTQQNHWRDSVAIRVGAGGRVGDVVRLRGGVYVDGVGGAPPPPDHLSPSSPDSTRLAATAGLGIQAGRYVRIDGFVEPMLLLPRSSTGDDAVLARYQGWAIAGGLGVTVQVAPKPAPVPVAPPTPPPPLPEPEVKLKNRPVTPVAPPPPAPPDVPPPTPWTAPKAP